MIKSTRWILLNRMHVWTAKIFDALWSRRSISFKTCVWSPAPFRFLALLWIDRSDGAGLIDGPKKLSGSKEDVRWSSWLIEGGNASVLSFCWVMLRRRWHQLTFSSERVWSQQIHMNLRNEQQVGGKLFSKAHGKYIRVIFVEQTLNTAYE